MNYPVLAGTMLPHPTSWEVENIVAETDTVSLGGTSMADVLYYKYKYTLVYETINETDYLVMKNIVNSQYITNAVLTFIYEKFPELSQPKNVFARMATKEFVAGSGTDYISKVTLVLTEIDAR